MFAVRPTILSHPPNIPSLLSHLPTPARFLSTLPPPPPPSAGASPFRANLIRRLLPPGAAQKPIASASARGYARHVSGGNGPYGYGAATRVPVQSAFESNGGWMKIGITAGLVAGSVVLAQGFLNRETRGAFHPLERDHLNRTFGYVGLGLALTAGSAYYLHKTGVSARIMSANPWVVLGGGLVFSIGSMYAVFNTRVENRVQKLAFFGLFQVAQAVAIAPLLFLSPALLARAGLYTVGVVGSLAYVGATAKQDKFLYLGGPILAGIVVVALTSLAPMILPRTAVRSLAVTEAICLYGGLAVFSGAILYDTQKILLHGRQAAMGGAAPLDPVAESIGLELHILNIFVRLVQILAMQQNRRK